jgi:hypothetical protein
MATPAQRSAWRRLLFDLHRRLGELLDSIEADYPTFAGVVYQLRTRCGKPRCVCREGKLHVAWCVSYVQAGRRFLRTIPPRLLPKLQGMAERYRALRKLRAELARTFARLLVAFDRLERSLRVPPSQALPRRRARGGS